MLGDNNTKLLRRFFKDYEWDYLKSVASFMAVISDAKDTVEDVDHLVSIGGRLIHDAEIEVRSKQRAVLPPSTCDPPALPPALGSA
jgi:hypothetical protein